MPAVSRCSTAWRVILSRVANDEAARLSRSAIFSSCAEAPGILGSKAIKWNFNKFLVGKDGQVIRRYAPTDAPKDLEKDIEQALAA